MDWFQDHEPEMVILEWRIPVLSGAKVMQRVAMKPDKNPPRFVVVSSSLSSADMPLLRELGVGGVVSKPISRKDLMSTLLKANAGASQPAGVYFEQQIRALIRARKIKKAMGLARTFLANPEVDAARKMLIQADFTLATKKFESSRDLCLKAMSLPHDTLYGLQILGKSFMGLRQFDYAMKCFDKAQALSPMNIERICLMAVSEAEQGHKDAANSLIDAAKSVDSKNEMVLETAVNVAVVQGDIATARKNIGDLPNIMGVVAFQNNRAVAMAKALRIPESIDIYAKTIQVLPEKAYEAMDIVLFNLALAYVKIDDLGMADEILAKIGSHGDSRVTQKAKNLRKRIGDAISTGAKLSLKTDDPVIMAGAKSAGDDSHHEPAAGDSNQELSSDSVRMLSLVDFKPGDLGCFKLFTRESASDADLQQMLNTLPPIKSRWSVVAKA
jgi:tetratricopeptide (TPR) repeat protein